MTVDAHASAAFRGHIATAASFVSKSLRGGLSGVARYGGKAMAGAYVALQTLQVARMMSALSDMSDQQLAEIGILRSDIPEYAKTLMKDE